MLKLFKYLKREDWFKIVIAIGLIITQVWLDLKMPDYTKKLTELVSSSQITMRQVWLNGGLMLICALGSMVCSFLCGYIMARMASGLSRNLRTAIFNKVSDFSPSEMKKFSVPSLITRTTNDVGQVQMALSMGMQVVIKAPILAIWAMMKISATSIEWTLATLIAVGIIVLVVSIIMGLCVPRFKRIQGLVDNLNNATRENVSGVRVVRAFNAEEYQEAKFEKANTQLTKNQLFTSRTMGLMDPVMHVCMNGLTLAVYWIGAYLMNKAPIVERAVVIGNTVSFTQYAMQVVSAFMMLIMVFVFLPRAMVSARRINQLLSTKPSIVSGVFENKTQTKGLVQFKNVSFKYSDGTQNAISNITFTANPGEIIAIIGATGSGKTTLINLIPRFNDVSAGEVLIDGVNVKEYKMEELQRRVAIVSQKAVLFKGDVQSNIVYGSNEQVDEKKLSNALKIAEAKFVFKLTNGVNSPVAQGGTNFSGGQKQRLSIARAIYKNADIIIFDDSFSALDYKTDSKVRQNINKKLKDKTIIIVAQRIGTIRNADKILVIDDGKIVGEGRHEELLSSCSVYKEIALSQLSKEEL